MKKGPTLTFAPNGNTHLRYRSDPFSQGKGGGKAVGGGGGCGGAIYN